MKPAQFLRITILLLSPFFFSAVGCGGGNENSVISPGELTDEQMAEMDLGSDLASSSRTPQKGN